MIKTGYELKIRDDTNPSILKIKFDKNRKSAMVMDEYGEQYAIVSEQETSIFSMIKCKQVGNIKEAIAKRIEFS